MYRLIIALTQAYHIDRQSTVGALSYMVGVFVRLEQWVSLALFVAGHPRFDACRAAHLHLHNGSAGKAQKFTRPFTKIRRW